MLCPCGRQKKYLECCSVLLSGETSATTPEALMRSRYTAFSQKNVDYLFSTLTPELQAQNSREELLAFADAVDSWTKLEILNSSVVSSYTTEANVEFAAYFIHDGKEQRIHENSHFVKQDGKWLYAGHSHQCSSHHHHHHQHHHEPSVTAVKIGRNDLCHCGSGKKYKKCCIT